MSLSLEARSALNVFGIAAASIAALGALWAIEDIVTHGGPGHLMDIIFGDHSPRHTYPSAPNNPPDGDLDLTSPSVFDREVRRFDDLVTHYQYLLDEFKNSGGDYSSDPRYQTLLDDYKRLLKLDADLHAIQHDVDSLSSSDDPALRAKVMRELDSIGGASEGRLEDTRSTLTNDLENARGILKDARPGQFWNKETGRWEPLDQSTNPDGHTTDYPASISNRLAKLEHDLPGSYRITEDSEASGDPHVTHSLHKYGLAVDLVPNNWSGSMSLDERAALIARDLAIARGEGFEGFYEDTGRNLTPEFREALARHGVQVVTGGSGPHLHLQFRDLAGGPGSR